MRRRLDRVDVVVVGAGVVRAAPEDRLEDRDDLLCPFLRLAVEGPQVPGAQIHQTLGEQRRGVQVVGVAPRDLPHRSGVGTVERAPAGARIDRVAQ